MKLTIIGTGYVGLVTGACFAEMGNDVICVDVDKEKIKKLRMGILPIYEPGLESIVLKNYENGNLKFTDSIENTPKEGIFFIAVGTPSDEDGSADLTHVLHVAKEIGNHIDGYSIIVDKSTVPVGTADKVCNVIFKELLKRDKINIEYDVVSNPEFLKEGNAVSDFMKPDRIIIGTNSFDAKEIMSSLYKPFSQKNNRIIVMGIKDAEMTKYTANSMLATKISFMNEIANVCEKLGVDVENVRKGIGSDSRIGYSFIYPGCGYGGSCFPKDVKALIRTCSENDYMPYVLNAVEKRNESQKYVLVGKIIKRFGYSLPGMTIGLWGLSFKPGTDDLREAPSKTIIKKLIELGVKIKVYDPVAMDEAKKQFPAEWFKYNMITLCDNMYDAIEDVSALVLVTEWKTFKQPDFELLKKKMKEKIIFDGRNQYDPNELIDFEYHGIGREF